MFTTEGAIEMTYVLSPTIDDEHYVRIRYPFWYRSLHSCAQTLCHGLDDTGALWMVASKAEWEAHPDNIIPATPGLPGTPAIPRVVAAPGIAVTLAVPAVAAIPPTLVSIRTRSTMIRPLAAVPNNASTGAVANFNRAWITFNKWMEAETKLSTAIILS